MSPHDFAAVYRRALEDAARRCDRAERDRSLSGSEQHLAGWLAEQIRALPVPTPDAGGGDGKCVRGTAGCTRLHVMRHEDCAEPTPAERIASHPHPSERGVEKLPPDEVLGLFRKAAEQMTPAKRPPLMAQPSNVVANVVEQVRAETSGDCDDCDGTGETWNGADWSGHKDCDACGGTGMAKR